jgi:cytochrome P450
MTRRAEFPKPVHIYGILDLFGRNVVSSEGNEWRRHRKITGPPFSEKNNHLVWTETLHQTQNMLKQWMGDSTDRSPVIDTTDEDAMRLSLHVITKSGFNLRLLWPGVETPAENSASDALATEFEKGHKISFMEAIGTLLKNVILVLILPEFVLTMLPVKLFNKTHQAYNEFGKYLNEMLVSKQEELDAENIQKGPEAVDLMASLMKSSEDSGKAGKKAGLEKDEILGNMFVFLLAGHETSANSIFFSLLLLALNRKAQKHLQSDLDSIFEGRPISEWDYDRDLPKLFGGMAGAVLAEELRLLPAVCGIPKYTWHDQELDVNGKKCIIPARTMITLSAVQAHRNPKFWSAVTGKPDPNDERIHPTSNTDNDLEEFKPERWLLDDKASSQPPSGSASPTAKPTNGKATLAQGPKTAESEDLAVNLAADTAASLYKPVKGAYVPFSDGFRACLGRRFAQVEVLAVYAVIFSQYSVELDVGEWASDEQLEAMAPQAREEVWQKAKRRLRRMMRENLGSVITLQMRKGKVPLRVVRRGAERFM